MTYTSLFKNPSIVLSKAYLCMTTEWTGRLQPGKINQGIIDVMKEVINLKGNIERVALELVKREEWGLKGWGVVSLGRRTSHLLPIPLPSQEQNHWVWFDSGESGFTQPSPSLVMATPCIRLLRWKAWNIVLCPTLLYPIHQECWWLYLGDKSSIYLFSPTPTAATILIQATTIFDPDYFNSFLIDFTVFALALPNSIFNTTARIVLFKG